MTSPDVIWYFKGTRELGVAEGIVLGPTLPKIFTVAFVKNKPRQQYYIGVVGIGTFCVAGLSVY